MDYKLGFVFLFYIYNFATCWSNYQVSTPIKSCLQNNTLGYTADWVPTSFIPFRPTISLDITVCSQVATCECSPTNFSLSASQYYAFLYGVLLTSSTSCPLNKDLISNTNCLNLASNKLYIADSSNNTIHEIIIDKLPSSRLYSKLFVTKNNELLIYGGISAGCTNNLCHDLYLFNLLTSEFQVLTYDYENLFLGIINPNIFSLSLLNNYLFIGYNISQNQLSKSDCYHIISLNPFSAVVSYFKNINYNKNFTIELWDNDVHNLSVISPYIYQLRNNPFFYVNESDALYIYGGTTDTGMSLKDIWIFNIYSNSLLDVIPFLSQSTYFNSNSYSYYLTQDSVVIAYIHLDDPSKYSILRFKQNINIITAYMFTPTTLFSIPNNLQLGYIEFTNLNLLFAGYYIKNKISYFDIHVEGVNDCIQDCYYGYQFCESLPCQRSCAGQFLFDDALSGTYVEFTCGFYGECNDNSCVCESGYQDDFCLTVDCPNNCSNTPTTKKEDLAQCINSFPFSHCECSTSSRRGGDDCSVIYCLNNCAMHGTCVNGVCQCDAFFEGPDCSIYNIHFLITDYLCTNQLKLIFIMLLSNIFFFS